MGACRGGLSGGQIPRTCALTVACLFVAAILGAPVWAQTSPAPPREAPATVALVIAPDLHGPLTQELRRELEASRFLVLSVPQPPTAAQSGVVPVAESLLEVGPVTSAASAKVIAVLVPAAGGVIIYTADATAAGSNQPRPARSLSEAEVRGEQTDRFSRRRLCLAVVERLRRIGEEAPVEAPPAPAVPPAVRPPAPLPVPAAATTAPPPLPPPTRKAWWFGVTSDLNVLSARGTPTAHIALIAERPFGGEGPLSLTVRAAWPVLGAQFTDDEGRFVRTWTFAAESGLRLRLRDRSASLRPVLGAALGVRSALSDTGEFELRASHITMTPALSLGLSAGLRYRVRPLVDLVFETDLSQGLLLMTDRRPYEKAAARERLLRISFGVLFEY